MAIIYNIYVHQINTLTLPNDTRQIYSIKRTISGLNHTATLGVFTPLKLAKATNWDFPLSTFSPPTPRAGCSTFTSTPVEVEKP